MVRCHVARPALDRVLATYPYDTRNSVDLATLFSPNFLGNPLRIQGFDIITLSHDGVLGLDLPT